MDTAAWLPDLEGRAAVITGAASGLGRAMAERCAAAGMRVVVSDIDSAGAEHVAGGLRRTGHDARAVAADVSRYADVQRLADLAFDQLGRVDVLCNNAGVVKSARAWALTLDDWHWVLGVDLWSVIHAIRVFVPRLLAQAGRAHIVNTASMTGLLPMPRLAAYSAAKSAVVALSESLLYDLEAEGADIGVSVFCPGFIATRITESARNRPASLPETAPESGPRTVHGVRAAMTAEQAADQVVDAIRAGRFWILTHADYSSVIEERAATIGTGARPRRPPVW